MFSLYVRVRRRPGRVAILTHGVSGRRAGTFESLPLRTRRMGQAHAHVVCHTADAGGAGGRVGTVGAHVARGVCGSRPKCQREAVAEFIEGRYTR